MYITKHLHNHNIRQIFSPWSRLQSKRNKKGIYYIECRALGFNSVFMPKPKHFEMPTIHYIMPHLCACAMIMKIETQRICRVFDLVDILLIVFTENHAHTKTAPGYVPGPEQKATAC